jgi:hypothetical protein
LPEENLWQTAEALKCCIYEMQVSRIKVFSCGHHTGSDSAKYYLTNIKTDKRNYSAELSSSDLTFQ